VPARNENDYVKVACFKLHKRALIFAGVSLLLIVLYIFFAVFMGKTEAWG
jgi:hypothetical protein